MESVCSRQHREHFAEPLGSRDENKRRLRQIDHEGPVILSPQQGGEIHRKAKKGKTMNRDLSLL